MKERSTHWFSARLYVGMITLVDPLLWSRLKYLNYWLDCQKSLAPPADRTWFCTKVGTDHHDCSGLSTSLSTILRLTFAVWVKCHDSYYYIAMTLSTHVHATLRMKCNNFSDPLTSHSPALPFALATTAFSIYCQLANINIMTD